MGTLYTCNNWGSVKKKTDRTLEIRSERSRDGSANLTQEEGELLKNRVVTSDKEPIKTQYFNLAINFEGENVTLAWPSEAGEEKATFPKEKLLAYLS